MGQTTGQIEADIRHTRDDLHSNFQELETKVKSVTDWKQHFQNHPASMVAAAFGAGALLATLGRGRTRNKSRISSGDDAGGSLRTPGQRSEVLQTWDNVKSALVGVAATQVTGFLGRLVPGFHEHLKKTEGGAERSTTSRNGV